MSLDIVEALRQALWKRPEARDAIAAGHLWAFVSSLLDEPELYAAAAHFSQSHNPDLGRVICDASGAPRSESYRRQVIAKLYERAVAWRLGNFHNKKSMVSAPDNLCITSLEEFGIALALLLEESVVDAIEARVAPGWVADVLQTDGSLSGPSAREQKAEHDTLHIFNDEPDTLWLRIRKWGEFLTDTNSIQPLALAASQRLGPTKEAVETLVEFATNNAGENAEVAIVQIANRPCAVLIPSESRWLDTASHLSWMGKKIALKRDNGHLLLDVGPVAARMICRRASEDSEQGTPCIHFTKNG